MPYHQVRDPARLQELLDAALALAGDLELGALLDHVVTQARALAGARYAALGILGTGGEIERFVHSGIDPVRAAAIGDPPRGRGLLGLLRGAHATLRLRDVREHPDFGGFPPNHPEMTSFLGVPICLGEVVFGNLYLADKIGAEEFGDEDVVVLEALAIATGIAIDKARLAARVAELEVAKDRARIAHDLHDTVIQRLFATGLSLQTAADGLSGRAAERVHGAIDDLDDTIRQIRTAIFALEPPPTAEASLRSRVLEISRESARSLGFEPEVRLGGPLDEAVDEPVAGHVLAVVREALANVARHARAEHVRVELSVDSAELCLVVSDDGVGLAGAPGPGHRGLTNIRERAEELCGTCSVAQGSAGGVEIRWAVPLAGS